ncbi:hypothetical protein HYC85_003835 [Camellia sinensis]|uniref:Uncharacterized protein n=1 Tax=Camellia sinensis TaxID=4442 RepID=A0A7J7HUT1_CAMSI|nr:hypothetical protein HYC85_003835 [Camellia sinensis]
MAFVDARYWYLAKLYICFFVGTIVLLALTRLVVFMLFFLAATVNAIIIYLLVSLAAAGGFLALFFACVTTIYIGALGVFVSAFQSQLMAFSFEKTGPLSVAVFVISTATISAIIAVLIATSWIGFFWTMWLATKKSVGLAKHSLTVTRSTLSAYSSAQHVRSRHEA